MSRFQSNMFIHIVIVLFCVGANPTDVFSQKQQYLKVIGPYLCAATVFPDSMYQVFDWRQFENWEAAQQPVDLNNPDYHLLNAAVFYHTNQYRQQMKKPPLYFAAPLRNAAWYHCIQMSERGFYNHHNPFDKKMRDPEQRMKNFGMESEVYAENINKEFVLDYKEGKYYYNDSSGWYYTGKNKEYIAMLSYNELAKRIVQTWIASKPHQQNMLDRHLTHLGCAVVLDKKTLNTRDIPKVIATQNFAGIVFSNLYNLK